MNKMLLNSKVLAEPVNYAMCKVMHKYLCLPGEDKTHSFIFINHCILIRVTVGPESIPGSLDTRQEFTLFRIVVHCMVLISHVHSHTQSEIDIAMILKSGRKPENPTHEEHRH